MKSEKVKGVCCVSCERMCWIPQDHEGDFTCGHCLEVKAAMAHAVEVQKVPEDLHEPKEVTFHADTRYPR